LKDPVNEKLVSRAIYVVPMKKMVAEEIMRPMDRIVPSFKNWNCTMHHKRSVQNMAVIRPTWSEASTLSPEKSCLSCRNRPVVKISHMDTKR
jgi:hypothetical protein